MKEIVSFSKTLKVLFCEDDKVVRVVIERLLRRFFDDIVIAVDGEDGLAKFKEGKIASDSKPFDIVFTDINMPIMNGIEMLDHIKALDTNISCVILSAHNEVKDFMDAIKLGVDGYILKPIEMNQFLDVLNKVINKIKLEHDNKLFKSDLERLNQNLQLEVDNAVEDMRIKDVILSQNSKMAAMGEMIDSVAHQWMQPISTIGVGLQSLELDIEFGTLDATSVQSKVDNGKLQIEHLTNTIEEFRSFFRPNTNIEQVYLKAIIDSSMILLKDTLIQNNIITKIIGDDEIVTVNSSEFKHIIINIVNNAKDAFKSASIDKKNREIIFEINKKDEKVIFMIKDNAGGIKDDVIKRIFEPYFTTKEINKGSGIGLYMTKQIVDKNNSKISVSNIENGACFKIEIGEVL